MQEAVVVLHRTQSKNCQNLELCCENATPYLETAAAAVVAVVAPS